VAALGLSKPLEAVRGTRTLRKADMIHNNGQPLIEVDPENLSGASRTAYR